MTNSRQWHPTHHHDISFRAQSRISLNKGVAQILRWTFKSLFSQQHFKASKIRAALLAVEYTSKYSGTDFAAMQRLLSKCLAEICLSRWLYPDRRQVITLHKISNFLTLQRGGCYLAHRRQPECTPNHAARIFLFIGKDAGNHAVISRLGGKRRVPPARSRQQTLIAQTKHFAPVGKSCLQFSVCKRPSVQGLIRCHEN